jgi:phosphoglycolate phosphatase
MASPKDPHIASMSPSNTQPIAVLFDLDGTLIDSLPGIVSAYHHLLRELDLGDLPDEDVRKLVGQNISAVLSERFGLSGDRLNRGISVFRDNYGTTGLYRYSKYDGVDDALRKLREDGVTLCIATSKLRSMATDLLSHAGWSRCFAVVSGAEPDGSRIHKRDIIAWSLGQLPRGTRAVAMVGDRGLDIEGGQEMGLLGIGVTWGYGDPTELAAAGASAIVDSPRELLDALYRSM